MSLAERGRHRFSEEAALLPYAECICMYVQWHSSPHCHKALNELSILMSRTSSSLTETLGPASNNNKGSRNYDRYDNNTNGPRTR